MRRILSVLMVVALFVSHVAFFSPKTAFAAAGQVCALLEVTYRNDTVLIQSVTLSFVDTVTFTVNYGSATLTLAPGETATLRLARFIPGGVWAVSGGPLPGVTFIDGRNGIAPDSICEEFREPVIHDGRLNPYDLAAPVAAYCEGAAVAVYDINEWGQGYRAFVVIRAEIDAALSRAVASGQNVVIAQLNNTALYALSSNELTLVGHYRYPQEGKPYQTILPDNPCSIGFVDGRLNNSVTDIGAPLTAYCEFDGIEVYDINEWGQGYSAFVATRAEIDAALLRAVASGHNVVIADVNGTALYALSSNELTLVGRHRYPQEGKLYQRILRADACA